MCANLRSMHCTKLPRLASGIWIMSALSAHKAPQTYNVFHSILSAAGTASCPSITRHPERRLGSAAPAFRALDVHHPILFAGGTASCPSITWHPKRRSGSATPAFGALDVHHSILFAVGTASWPSITWHPKNRLGSAAPAFGALDVHHPILFAVGTASCPSITWHPERRYGPATTAFGVLDVHHPMLFTLGTASCPSITRHPERRLGSATPAFGVPEVDHTIPFADGTARWSCIMLKSKRRVEHTSTHTGAKPACLCANVCFSIHQASIDKEAVGRAALAMVALSSQNMREQQPACSPAIFNQHQKLQLIDRLGGSKNEASIFLVASFRETSSSGSSHTLLRTPGHRPAPAPRHGGPPDMAARPGS